MSHSDRVAHEPQHEQPEDQPQHQNQEPQQESAQAFVHLTEQELRVLVSRLEAGFEVLEYPWLVADILPCLLAEVLVRRANKSRHALDKPNNSGNENGRAER